MDIKLSGEIEDILRKSGIEFSYGSYEDGIKSANAFDDVFNEMIICK